MEVDGVCVVFDEWGGQIQQFFECGTGEDIFGRGGDDVTGVGEGDFIDNDDWCCLLDPMRQTNLSAGARMVPPKFLKLWRMVIPFPDSPARTAKLGLLERRDSLALGLLSLFHAER